MNLQKDRFALPLSLHGVDADVVKQTGAKVHQGDRGLRLGQSELSAAAFHRRCVRHAVTWRKTERGFHLRRFKS